MLTARKLLRLDAIEARRIFLIRVGLWVELPDSDITFGILLIFLEQILHALRIGLQVQRHVLLTFGDVVTDFHRPIELCEDLLCARRKRVKLFSREVDAGFDCAEHEVGSHQDEKHGRDANDGVEQRFDLFLFIHASRKLAVNDQTAGCG